jgi:hypothetical protein
MARKNGAKNENKTKRKQWVEEEASIIFHSKAGKTYMNIC